MIINQNIKHLFKITQIKIFQFLRFAIMKKLPIHVLFHGGSKTSIIVHKKVKLKTFAINCSFPHYIQLWLAETLFPTFY